MHNFSRKIIRLDSTSSLMKVASTFYKCLAITLIIYTFFQMIPTFGNSKAPQSVLTSKMLLSPPVHENVQDSSPPLKGHLIVKTQETLEPLEISETMVFEKASPIPACLYLHLENSTKFSWVPAAFEERISENDILVDLSFAIDPNGSYELSSYNLNLVNLAVQYEAGYESFLGQLLVAEDIIGRIRSGIYGPDVSAILVKGYQADVDEMGNLHFYYGPKEILEASSSVQQAVKLALSGSRVSYYVLKAVTELRNEQYGLQLDDTYYKWGAMYHFNPEDVKSIGLRSINQVPVSFQYGSHIFYGCWLPKSAQLSL